jgi:fructoselysine-6-P-deglycase FrlB-like protein
VGDPASPIATACDSVLALRFADDQSVVQTRFVTAVVALARGACDEDLTTVATAGEDALHSDLPLDVTQFDHHVFLGDGWTAGLADAAALFVRETAQAWTESYPALEYRHGPIAVAGERSAVWAIGDIPDDLADDVAATGATVVRRDIDPLARIIEVQRAALELAAHRGVDPDNPRHLTRAVVLDG